MSQALVALKDCCGSDSIPAVALLRVVLRLSLLVSAWQWFGGQGLLLPCISMFAVTLGLDALLRFCFQVKCVSGLAVSAVIFKAVACWVLSSPIIGAKKMVASR